jgi:hypothetical protein
MLAEKIFLSMLIFGWSLSIFARPEGLKIIYIIHGDGNYLYHDEEGNELNAAERILEQSKYVAENISRGEVFIFYQKPSADFLFFTKDDGEFYYYRKGINISGETYSRKDAEDFEIEAGLINKYSETSDIKTVLLYYGHQIPLQENFGYHSSYPEKEFDIYMFADGIKDLSSSLNSSEEKFDLIILSTCKNGNRETISSVSTLTDYLLASPVDIHLSHLNSESLVSLSNEKYLSIFEMAKHFAESAFTKLSEITATEIHINVYDLKIKPETEKTLITEFYRPPKFGRRNITIE